MLGETSKEYDATYGGSFDISTQSSSVENDPGIKVEARIMEGKEYACVEGASFRSPCFYTPLFTRIYRVNLPPLLLFFFPLLPFSRIKL